MVRMEYAVSLQYDVQSRSDFVFNICAAHTASQRVLSEKFTVHGAVSSSSYTDMVTANRFNRVACENGLLTVRYRAVVEINHSVENVVSVHEREIRRLPSDVLPYILPSRFCPSDKMRQLALAMFGNMEPNYERVASICRWVNQHVRFKSGASNATTCAMETFNTRAGVCRDFSHLMITMCRALNIPARYVTGVDFGADPALGPTDFHAYVEVFIGQRWYLFDATGLTPVMGLIRIGTGHDAADASFATMFGNMYCLRPEVEIDLIASDCARLHQDDNLLQAVSTASDGLYFQGTPIVCRLQPVPISPCINATLQAPQSWFVKPGLKRFHAASAGV